MFDPQEITASSFTAVEDETRLALLRSQLDYARQSSSFYRAHLADAPLPDSLEALSALPLMDAETLRAAGRQAVCVDAGAVARIVSLHTSGSTGDAKRLYFTEGDLGRTAEFFAEGMAWMCAPGDRVAVLMPCGSPDGIGDLLCRALRSIGVEPLAIGIPQDYAAVGQQLLEARPAVLVGFPWHVRLLALRCPTLRPRAVLLSGDYTPAGLPPLVQSLWGCRVLNHFGMTETGYGCAVEHPCGSVMYLRRDELIAEVIDPESGAVLPAGTEGELVLTTLRREAMPLIRYRTGDLAVLDERGDLLAVHGRRSAAPGFYETQDALSALPWLFDYRIADGILTAELSLDAPDDAAARLLAASGAAACVPERSAPAQARAFDLGKRTLVT